MSQSKELDSLREKMIEVTNQIIKLSGSRLSITKEIDKIKSSMNLPVINYKVEKELKNSVIKACEEYGIDKDFGLRILNLLIEESVRIQKRSNNVKKSYTTMDMFTLARQMERDGKSIIHLEVGEPDFGPPQIVKEKTYEALEKGYTHYTEPYGIPDLRNEISNFINTRYGIDITHDQVAITNGGRFAVYASILSILRPGYEAIVIQPAWPAYVDCIQSIGCKAICLKTKLEENWKIDIDLLSELISETTKLIIINYPNNPTGKILETRELKDLIELAKKRNIVILSDEVYSDYSYEPSSSLLNFDSKSISVFSFSKSYGMTGFRIGYCISDIETIKKISKIQALTSTSVPEFIQYSAIEALKSDEVKNYSNLIQHRIKQISTTLESMNIPFYKPQGGFYVFPKISDDKNFDIVNFCLNLLEQKGVCVSPGTTFGDYPNYIRISACQKQQIIQEGLKRIDETLK